MTAPELHKHFEELTGQKLTLSYERMRVWAEYVTRGLTGEDLALVIRWTKAQIARGEGGFSALSLQWRAMVADLDRFEDRLNVARQRCAKRAAPAKKAAAAGEAEPLMSDEEWERQAREMADGLGNFRQSLRGGGQ